MVTGFAGPTGVVVQKMNGPIAVGKEQVIPRAQVIRDSSELKNGNPSNPDARVIDRSVPLDGLYHIGPGVGAIPPRSPSPRPSELSDMEIDGRAKPTTLTNVTPESLPIVTVEIPQLPDEANPVQDEAKPSSTYSYPKRQPGLQSGERYKVPIEDPEVLMRRKKK